MSSTKDLIKHYYEARDEVDVRVQLLDVAGHGLSLHIWNERDNETFCEIDLNKVDQKDIRISTYKFTDCWVICTKCLKEARS